MSFSDEFSCPACGSAIVNVNALTRSLECPHCASWVYLSNNNWASAGQFPEQIEAPPFLHISRQGKLDQRVFTVAGRIRLGYSGGFWDEWWLAFEDGGDQWLEEDDGSYHLHVMQEFEGSVAAAQQLSAGEFFTAGGINWFVTEVEQAKLLGAQGQLPVSILPGTTLGYVDAVADGRELSMEIWGNKVTASVSEPVAANRLSWT